MKNMHAKIYMDCCRHLLNWQIQIRANGITLKLRYASRTFNLLAIFRIPTKLFIRVCVCVRIFTTNLFHRCTFCPPHANVKLFSVQANKFQFCHIDFLWLIFVECEHFVQCNTLTCNTYLSNSANSKSTMKCWRWFLAVSAMPTTTRTLVRTHLEIRFAFELTSSQCKITTTFSQRKLLSAKC